MTEEIESDRPLLDCPNCGEPLIPASGRGGWDDDGDFVEHGEGCRCPWCEWVWHDDAEPVRCKCGALVKVAIDDEHAYATEVPHG